jgi:hypothetical protein
LLSNQSEINSQDQYVWRTERSNIYNRLDAQAKSLGITTCHTSVDIGTISKNASDKLLITTLFDLVPSIDQYQQIDKVCQQLGKKIWWLTDNVIVPDQHIFKNIKVLSRTELLGMTATSGHIPSVNLHPTRLYNCFIQRCESVRQSWFYFLHLNNLLDQGYVSFLLYQLNEYSELTGVELFDFIHHQRGLAGVLKFTQAYQVLRDQVPFRNFDENYDLSRYICDSKYSLILETYAVEDHRSQWCFTEKILRSLQSPTINLAFIQQYGARELKKLGLEVDLVMEALDHLEWIPRQQALLDILIHDTIAIDSTIKYNQCKHNQNMLTQWKQAYQKSTFFDDIFEEIKHA